METLTVTSEQSSFRCERNRPVIAHENVTHIEASGGLETVLGLFPWSMNELAEYLVNREYMDELMIEVSKLSARKDAA
ncbi:hypothetical protein [Providencia huaxiensis]|uniref:hypothetical protein n=1 Tax=Providencia huaxiensis TaxID=2027290 RepID=UPI001EFD69EA|nr:hypothetical protein [Providencia huaxiensis]MCG9533969.1 hypothetical protein [Providencia huaxiensis]